MHLVRKHTAAFADKGKFLLSGKIVGNGFVMNCRASRVIGFAYKDCDANWRATSRPENLAALFPGEFPARPLIPPQIEHLKENSI